MIGTLALGISLLSVRAATFPNPYTTNLNAGLPAPTRTNSLFPKVVSVESYGAVGDGVTDDTAAFQNAINDITNTGGKIILQNKVYLINGAFTAAPGSANWTNFAQLHIPAINLQTNPIVGIWFEGVTKPTLNTIWNTNVIPLPTNNCTILSTRVPTNNQYAIIAGGAPSGSTVPQTAVYLRFDNIEFRTYDNPMTVAVNASKVAQFTMRDCVVDTGTGGGNQSNPTNGTSGLILPENNNWCISEVFNVDVRGYYRGIVVSEHSYVDEARVWMCREAFNFPGGTHSVHMGRTMVTACPVGVTGGPAGFKQLIVWDDYCVEHSALSTNAVAGDASWTTNIYDFADTNSILSGTVNVATIQSGLGPTNDLKVLSASTTNVDFFTENNHAFSRLRVTPLTTNDVDTFRMVYGKNIDGSDIFAIGEYVPGFQNLSGLWLGKNTLSDTVTRATNYAIISDGTNNTSVNAGQPEGGTAANSAVHIKVGNVNVADFSNAVVNVRQPLQHGFISLSNYVSGATNVNTWLGPISVKANISLTKAAVSGSASMQLWIIGVSTNSQADTTTATTIADSADFRQLAGDIPAGGSFIFTNNSTGAGNSSTLFKTEVKGD